MLDEVAYAIADRVGPAWWRVRPCELALYPRLGVAWFARRFVNGGSHGARNVPFLRRHRGSHAERLERFDRFARGIEAKHLVGIVLCSTVPAAAWAVGQGWLALALAAVNLIGHGYPIMSMRLSRGRAATALGRARRVARGARRHAESPSEPG